MKIGIDIDGVLNNIHDFVIEYGTKLCSEYEEYKIENINEQWSTEIFSWPKEMAHELWNRFGSGFYEETPVRNFASEVIKKLKDNNNDIYIITARKNNDEWFPPELRANVEEITIKWLEKNGIIYDKICFNSEDKSKVCKELDIDVMIEDDPKNIDMLVKNTKVFIFDTLYNRHNNYKEAIRVYSWYDVYNKLLR